MEKSSENDVPSWVDESTPLMGSGSNPFADDSDGDDDCLKSPLQSIGEGAAEQSKSTKSSPPSSANDWHTTTTKTSELSPNKATKGSKKKKKKANAKDEKNAAGYKIRLIRKPGKNCCLELFHWFEFLAVIPLLCLLAAQLFPIIFIPMDELGFVQTMIRIYVSFFTITLIMVEIHAPIPFLKRSYLLQAFFSRGFLHTFLAVMEMEEAYSDSADSSKEDLVNHAFVTFKIQWAPIFMQCTAWAIFTVGCIYMLFGLFCLQVLRDRLEAKYQEQMEEYHAANSEVVWGEQKKESDAVSRVVWSKNQRVVLHYIHSTALTCMFFHANLERIKLIVNKVNNGNQQNDTTAFTVQFVSK